MGKAKSQFVCQSCGTSYGKWAGKCENCGEWNTLVEQAVSVIANVATKARDRLNAKVEVEHIREAGRKPRSMQDGAQVSAYDSFDSPMAAAYLKLRPIHKRYKAGELSESDWFCAKDDILESMK